MDDKELNDMYGMTAQVDENGILTFEDGTQYDLNHLKEEEEKS